MEAKTGGGGAGEGGARSKSRGRVDERRPRAVTARSARRLSLRACSVVRRDLISSIYLVVVLRDWRARGRKWAWTVTGLRDSEDGR